ncbi:Bug family tripartite tricarboxylate transporter substrate binding protein [Hydrogenophaga palleronii]|uniref:Bug family tripartite tricarboxylate transporter substrate binding protein n=1 Tax=Hydrogenophaga palleronii TaxID=65655 RepID=UPI0008262689|nr:tripartite tricarboxylate transporter substrate binding protein [Hydrogenophaga palleronii]
MHSEQPPFLKPQRRRIACAWVAASALLLGASAFAQTSDAAWPQRTVTLVVPFAAGTATDVMARQLTEPLAAQLGVAVVIDNKPGASAAIGASAVARAAPDGYTILVGSSTTHAANAALFKKLSYDPIADFKPVTLLGYVPQVMMVNANSPVKSVKEFMDFAKANKGKVNYAQGSSGNLLPAAILNLRKDLGMTMVSYKSPPQAVQDLLGDQVSMMFGDLSVSLGNIKAGKLRPLAVTASSQQPLLPGVPPLSETLEGFELTTWIAMFAPARTPDAIVEKLRAAVTSVINDRAVTARINESGMRVQTSSSAELGNYVRSETVKWAGFVKEAGVQPE